MSNPRYIGKWYRNKENKNKRQNKLMPYNRYVEVSFDYGQVIDIVLWNKVQEKVEKLNNIKAKGVKRCYPLSGILKYKDGTKFIGNGAWGDTTVSTYYFNKKHNLRIKTDIIEKEAKKILLEIINNSEIFLKSFTKFMDNKEHVIVSIKNDINSICDKILLIEQSKKKLDHRLNFLLEDDDVEMAKLFKEEYKASYLNYSSQIKELESSKLQLQKSLKSIDSMSPNKSKLIQTAKKAIDYISTKDLISLKSIYQNLFTRIELSVEDSSKLQLKFVLSDSSLASDMAEDTFCISVGMVVVARIELATPAMSRQCSPTELYDHLI